MSLALGSWSPRLLKPLGISLPVYPVKGYSITVPIIDPDGAPVSTVMDESYKVAITRLGDRIRVGGTAEISGYSDKLYAARRATLDHSLTDLFPRGGDLGKATFWCGLRPMTPDGPPVIGADALRQSASQHRPRHARLDHGLRLGQGARGSAVGAEAGHRYEGAFGRAGTSIGLGEAVLPSFARMRSDEAIQTREVCEIPGSPASRRSGMTMQSYLAAVTQFTHSTTAFASSAGFENRCGLRLANRKLSPVFSDQVSASTVSIISPSSTRPASSPSWV